ncbi:MAG: hypothetical protein KAQ97_10120 [Candidatus Fermentibacteraceae bacterium]|nr:hypothetical protein [Candidatus Fermentibacteraceae bacterium]
MNKLEDLKWTPMWTTHIGCMHGCAEYLGINVSPAWISGSTGHAFIINIHDILCPSGPTAWKTEMLFDLSPNFGLKQECVFGWRGDEDLKDLQKKSWDFARKAIDEGKPCFGWELEVPEFYVIQGYDEKGYLYSGPLCDEGKGTKPWNELGDSDIGLIEVYSCGKCNPADTRKTLRDALQATLDHADNTKNWIMDKYHSGPDGFDTWIKAIEQENELPWGVAYNTEVWSECRKSAVHFLEEVISDFDWEIRKPLHEVIRLYNSVYQNLDKILAVYPFRGPGIDPEVSSSGRKMVIGALKESRKAETEALKLFRNILTVI